MSKYIKVEFLTNEVFMSKLNILVACEFIQTFTEIFRDMGHYAWSCDLQCCKDFIWHIDNQIESGVYKCVKK